MIECRSNEDEKEKYNIPTNLYEIISNQMLARKRHVILQDHWNEEKNLRETQTNNYETNIIVIELLPKIKYTLSTSYYLVIVYNARISKTFSYYDH